MIPKRGVQIPSFKIDAKMYGVTEAIDKANELVDTLKKANSLLEELAAMDIKVEFGNVNDSQRADD